MGPYVEEEVDAGFRGKEQDQWAEVIGSLILNQQ